MVADRLALRRRYSRGLSARITNNAIVVKKNLPNWDISAGSHSGSMLGYANEGDRKVHAAEILGE